MLPPQRNQAGTPISLWLDGGNKGAPAGVAQTSVQAMACMKPRKCCETENKPPSSRQIGWADLKSSNACKIMGLTAGHGFKDAGLAWLGSRFPPDRNEPQAVFGMPPTKFGRDFQS